MATTLDEYNPTTAKLYLYKGEKIVVTKIDGGLFFAYKDWAEFQGFTKDLSELNIDDGVK